MTNISAVCVFCGSRSGENPLYTHESETLGRMLADQGKKLVYGGGGIGLMAAVANAAVGAGGEVLGIIPEFLREYEVGTVEGATEVLVDGMHNRKAKMFEASDAFVIMPGGLGTLDESIEIITWKQLQQHNKPIIFVNIDGYWNPFLALVDQVVEAGFGHEKVKDLYQVVDTVEQIFAAMDAAPDADEAVLLSHL